MYVRSKRLYQLRDMRLLSKVFHQRIIILFLLISQIVNFLPFSDKGLTVHPAFKPLISSIFSFNDNVRCFLLQVADALNYNANGINFVSKLYRTIKSKHKTFLKTLKQQIPRLHSGNLFAVRIIFSNSRSSDYWRLGLK